MTKLKEISASVNSTRSEISATAENTEYCLERNSLELTYIFEMLSKEYDAIVFEDMDVTLKSKVISIEGEKAGIEFIDVPFDVANRILYRYMQQKSVMKLSIK